MKTYFAVLLLAVVLAGCSSVPPVPPTIFLAGDSTLADKKTDRRPETGWGEMLHEYFTASVTVDNHARNGRSTKSFREEGLWETMIARVRPGDYVFIEFGHNDAKLDSARYSSPEDYAKNLAVFVGEVRARNARPVLLTPIVRRKFDDTGILLETHGGYPEAVRQTARATKAPLIDLNELSRSTINGYGPERSKELFLWLDKGESPNYPKGVMDDTHLNTEGGRVIAGLVAEAIRRTKLPLRKYLKPVE